MIKFKAFFWPLYMSRFGKTNSDHLFEEFDSGKRWPKNFQDPISRYFKAGPATSGNWIAQPLIVDFVFLLLYHFVVFFHFEGLRKKGGAQKGKTTRRKNTNTTTETKSWGEYCARRFPSEGKYWKRSYRVTYVRDNPQVTQAGKLHRRPASLSCIV